MAASILNYSDVRQNLKRTMDRVVSSRAPVTITRRNAESVVMIAESEMQALLETMHLLQSPANARRLMDSIAQAEDGDIVEVNSVDDAAQECRTKKDEDKIRR